MKVTFFGTTTLLFDDGKDAVLFDGFFTRPLLPLYRVGKVTTDTALADNFMSRYDFSRLRAIFVSHTHPDHVMDVPYIANRTGAQVFGSKSCRNVCLGGDVPEDRIHLFRTGASATGRLGDKVWRNARIFRRRAERTPIYYRLVEVEGPLADGRHCRDNDC